MKRITLILALILLVPATSSAASVGPPYERGRVYGNCPDSRLTACSFEGTANRITGAFTASIDYSTQGVPAIQPSTASVYANFVDSFEFEGASGALKITFRFFIDEAVIKARGKSFPLGVDTTSGQAQIEGGVRYTDDGLNQQVSDIETGFAVVATSWGGPVSGAAFEFTTTIRGVDGTLPAGQLEVRGFPEILANLGQGAPHFSEGWVDGTIRGTFLGYDVTVA